MREGRGVARRQMLIAIWSPVALGCATLPPGLDRPGAELAGCYVLSPRNWPEVPDGIMAPNPIYLNGPDTMERQLRLGYGPGIMVTGVGETRFSQEEAQLRYDRSRPLTVYPDVTAEMHMDNATWEVLEDGLLGVRWVMKFARPETRRETLRVELNLTLNPREQPFSGWATRDVSWGSLGHQEDGRISADSVRVSAFPISCPSEFPYVLPPPRVRGP